MAAKTEPDPKTDPPADPPADEGPKVDERMDRIEATQREQGGMLEKILERLPGKPEGDPKPDSDPAKGEPADIQSAVRREIAAARQREEAEARAKGDADWRAHVDEALETLKPEKPPREPQTGVKGKLQRAMFGSDR